jgi:hypothetical protein
MLDGLAGESGTLGSLVAQDMPRRVFVDIAAPIQLCDYAFSSEDNTVWLNWPKLHVGLRS